MRKSLALVVAFVVLGTSTINYAEALDSSSGFSEYAFKGSIYYSYADYQGSYYLEDIDFSGFDGLGVELSYNLYKWLWADLGYEQLDFDRSGREFFDGNGASKGFWDIDSKLTGIYYGASLQFPAWKRISAKLSMGLGNYDREDFFVDSTTNDPLNDKDVSADLWYLGLGASVPVYKKLSAFADVRRYNIPDGPDVFDGHLNVVHVGVSMPFGPWNGRFGGLLRSGSEQVQSSPASLASAKVKDYKPQDYLEFEQTYVVPFAFDSAVLDDAQKTKFKSWYNEMTAAGMLVSSIQVQGHTDAVGGSGYNRHLSKLRALQVKAMLAEMQVDATLIGAEGLSAQESPLSLTCPDGSKLDRRVEVLVKWASPKNSTKSSSTNNAATINGCKS